MVPDYNNSNRGARSAALLLGFPIVCLNCCDLERIAWFVLICTVCSVWFSGKCQIIIDEKMHCNGTRIEEVSQICVNLTNLGK